MDWYYLLIFSIGGALVLLTIVSIVFSLVFPVLDKWNKRYLVTHFSLQLLCMVACFIDALVYGNPEMVVLERIDVFFEFLLLVLIVAMPSILLSHYAGEKIKTGLLSELAIVFAMTHIILLIIAQFTDIFYQITPNHNKHLQSRLLLWYTNMVKSAAMSWHEPPGCGKNEVDT